MSFHLFGIYIFPDKIDIVDEAITFFRANVFFKNFDIKSPADKLLIYLTFYINVALKRLEGCRTLAVGTKAIINLGLEKVPVPGEPGFPFPGLFSVPRSQDEAGIISCHILILHSNWLKTTNLGSFLSKCINVHMELA